MSAVAKPEPLFSVGQSLTGRFWTLAEPDAATVRQLTAALGGDDLLARLLAARGVDSDGVEAYL
ncbi:MAG: single-stranded-DNA-specific exonuclease RecJ, partial [Pseudomonadota bacterium]